MAASCKSSPPSAAAADVDASGADPYLSGRENARLRLRRRWELASVLNFLHVFGPLIKSDLRLSAEEIETALISPNDALARLHIALLKGIPPVNKNLREPDVWITLTCKLLATWWQWVAEGENPLRADCGKEASTYKQHDPMIRLLILKALCEVRAEQDDVSRYITDEIKMGTEASTFCKERIGSTGNGTTYWYDGDPIIGQRLYREVKADFVQNRRRNCHLIQPANDFCWETIATNLDEFREITENLLSSNFSEEVIIGEKIKVEVLTVLEKLQKKKENALKRKQREVMLLDNFSNSNGFGIIRSRRERRPVSYTYDDYDRCIDEAIRLSNETDTESGSQPRDLLNGTGKALNGVSHSDKAVSTQENDSDEEKDHNKFLDNMSNGDNDGQINDEDDGHNTAANCGDSDEENVLPGQTKSKASRNILNTVREMIPGLRRSKRNAASYDPIASHGEVLPTGTKKMTRQRPTSNTNYVSDSEGDSRSYDQAVVADSETSSSGDGS